MAKLFSVCFAAAQVLSCNLEGGVIEVQDESLLVGVRLELDNNDPEWGYGDARRVIVTALPLSALVESVTLCADEGDKVLLSQGEEPSTFHVVACGEGPLRLEGRIEGYTIVDGKRVLVEKSSALDFVLVDRREKKPRPFVGATLLDPREEGSPIILSEEKCVNLSLNSSYVLDIDSAEGYSYFFSSSDETVLSLERLSKDSWRVYPSGTGECSLDLTIRDSEGDSFSYSFPARVYSHISLEALYDTRRMKAGLRVLEGGEEEVKASVEIFLSVYGYRNKDREDVLSYDLPSEQFSLDLGGEKSYPDLVDTTPAHRWIMSQWKGDEGNKSWYLVRGARMSILLNLEDPYVVVDAVETGVVDDGSFLLEVSFQQRGLEGSGSKTNG